MEVSTESVYKTKDWQFFSISEVELKNDFHLVVLNKTKAEYWSKKQQN